MDDWDGWGEHETTVDWSRWEGWRGWRTWIVGACAYYVWLSLPWVIAKRCNFMLPYVGDYSEWDDVIAAKNARKPK